jgi:hypothetical protein
VRPPAPGLTREPDARARLAALEARHGCFSAWAAMYGPVHTRDSSGGDNCTDVTPRGADPIATPT